MSELDINKVFQSLAGVLDNLFNPKKETEPRKVGFIVFTFPLDGTPQDRVNYVSNCGRDSVIPAIKEWIERKEFMTQVVTPGEDK